MQQAGAVRNTALCILQLWIIWWTTSKARCGVQAAPGFSSLLIKWAGNFPNARISFFLLGFLGCIFAVRLNLNRNHKNLTRAKVYYYRWKHLGKRVTGFWLEVGTEHVSVSMLLHVCVCVCALSSNQSELVHTCCGYKTTLGKQRGWQSLHSCFCLRWTMAEIVRFGEVDP